MPNGQMLKAGIFCLICCMCAGANAKLGSGDPLPLVHAKPVRMLQSDNIVKQIEVAARYRREIDIEVRATTAWREQALLAPIHNDNAASRTRSVPFLKWILDQWQERHKSAQQYAQNPPFKNIWLCIHGGEASWHYDKDAPGHNGLYDDGLQMNLSFQNSYAHALLYSHGVDRYGNPIWTGDHWSPLQQMWVGVYALKAGRGFYPWPNTARPCVTTFWVDPGSVRIAPPSSKLPDLSRQV